MELLWIALGAALILGIGWYLFFRKRSVSVSSPASARRNPDVGGVSKE